MDQIYVHIREIIYCYTYMDRIYDHIYETIYECTYMGPIYECWHMNTYMCTSDFHIPPTLEMSPTEIDVLVHSSVYIICKIVYFWKQYITCQLVYKYLPVCKHFTNAFACFWSVGTNKSFNSCIQRFFFTIWRFIFFLCTRVLSPHLSASFGSACRLCMNIMGSSTCIVFYWTINFWVVWGY